MNHFTVRPAEGKDSSTYAAWLQAAAAINLVDPGVYSYPTCNTLVVEKDEAPVLINSFQAAIVMEALAPKPGLSPMDEARALKVLFGGVTNIARATGVREVLFGCSDVRVENFVTRHGWEKLNFPMFRAKIEANQ